MSTGKPSYQYKILFSVQVSHPYYASGGPGGLTVKPTIHTLEIMKGLLLELRPTVSGFMIIYDALRLPALLHYLTNNGSWTCWSFTLTSADPYFLNVTDLPMDLLNKTLFLSNLYAHEDENKIFLHPGSYEKGAQSTPVSTAEVKVSLPDAGQQYLVQMLDISDAVVISRIVRASEDVPAVYVDLSALPEGRYTLRVKAGVLEKVIRQEEFIYIASRTQALGFFTLFLEAPADQEAALFPVWNGEITSKHYLVRFETRSTRWTYYVVLPGEREVRGLFIKSVDNDFHFDGPERVGIGDGVMAWRFISREPIPLKQLSPYKFKLYESRAGGAPSAGSLPAASREAGIQEEVVSRMAVAGASVILPVGGEVFSPIYITV